MESSVTKNETDDGSDVSFVRQQFEEFADSTIAARALWEKCRQYRDGDQLTEQERKTLKKRGQPPFIDNKIQDKCDTLLGIEKQMRTDPKAFPRTPQDEGSAEAATDSLRFIADQSNFNRTVRKPAADNLMVEGLCYGQVVVDPDTEKYGGYPKVCMEHIRVDRGYYDIHSLKDDFSDKTYAGFFTWMDVEDAKSLFDPKKNKLAHEKALEFIDSSVSDTSAAGDQTHDDKPRYVMSARGRERLQVFEHYFKNKGVWHMGKWCIGGWLEPAKESTYKNEFGEPECGIEVQALYRKGDDASPYGSVPRYLDPQDGHNKRHSKMLHLLNSKRLLYPKGAFDDPKNAREQLHKPDGVFEYNPMGPGNEVRVEDNLKEADAQFQLLQYTDLQLSQVGPNAALLGQSGNISGRAKNLDQQAGSLPISPLFDALDSWELRMFRQAWNRVKQFWTAEMWIRVTDDENKVRFVGLNQPVTMGHQMAESLKAEQIPAEQKKAVVMAMAQDPAMAQPYLVNGKPKIKNAVAQMDVDIIIDRTMDTVNLQQEQFNELVQVAKIRPEVPFKALLEMSQLRSETKKRVTDMISGENDPAAQQMAAMQAKLAELEAALKQADVIKAQASAQKDMATAKESEIDAIVKVAEFISPQPKPAGKTQVSVN